MLVRKIWPKIPKCKNSFDEIHQTKTNQSRFQIVQTKIQETKINGGDKTIQKNFNTINLRTLNGYWMKAVKILLTIASAKNELTVFYTRIGDKIVKPVALFIN